ncbi:heat shock protein DnaJ with tetratricopeptiderepeat [Striga asiatica]|uniref:Heat shock protein DnaJ with tetratricopeptiderepeat n=1 Tax=Striga asiatica TaxID=4170 RepID=A0A5A7QL85_STRAF|nr:heat shock protein DnaJ with tetratricopeptiderepeat [Striga asiatica]
MATSPDFPFRGRTLLSEFSFEKTESQETNHFHNPHSKKGRFRSKGRKFEYSDKHEVPSGPNPIQNSSKCGSRKLKPISASSSSKPPSPTKPSAQISETAKFNTRESLQTLPTETPIVPNHPDPLQSDPITPITIHQTTDSIMTEDPQYILDNNSQSASPSQEIPQIHPSLIKPKTWKRKSTPIPKSNPSPNNSPILTSVKRQISTSTSPNPLYSNPERISIWKQPWIPSIPKLNNHTSRQSQCRLNLVHELLDDTVRHWDLNTLNSYFSPAEVKEILKIRGLDPLGVDKLVWEDSSSTHPLNVSLVYSSLMEVSAVALARPIRAVEQL